jgi:hypothetical protein
MGDLFSVSASKMFSAPPTFWFADMLIPVHLALEIAPEILNFSAEY